MTESSSVSRLQHGHHYGVSMSLLFDFTIGWKLETALTAFAIHCQCKSRYLLDVRQLAGGT